MAHQSDPALLALHGERPRAAAEADGLVKHRSGGRLSGWMVAAGGKAADEVALAAELGTAGCRDAVADAYRRFLAHNRELLELCTAWQTDAAGDPRAVNRLAELDAAVQPVCDDLGGLLDRSTSYGRRLDDARQRVRAGEHDWFTQPTIDSYHTVWFQLHEDLLSTLGIQRGAEAGLAAEAVR